MFVIENNSSKIMIMPSWASAPKSCARIVFAHMFSSEICKIFKNKYFAKQLQTAAAEIWNKLEISLNLQETPQPGSLF